MTKKYSIDLDIGIGYVSFAVCSSVDDSVKNIEDLGIRFFESGETGNHKAKCGQVRRAYRNARRVLRRRTHRKDRVKAFLQKIGLLSLDNFRAWQEKNGNQNIFAVRVKGLSQKLAPEELADCIIHICNHRGYGEYYNEEISSQEAGLIKVGLEKFEELFVTGHYRSVADMILNDDVFKTETAFPNYHNHKDNGRYVLAKRAYIRKELFDILKEQAKYYPQLTKANIDFLCDKIVFAQRDFEDGPGHKNDKTRKFLGYLDSVGKCVFYKDEKRSFKSTILAEVYILVNRLSRYKYVDDNGEAVKLSQDVTSAILKEALLSASVSEKSVKVILKAFGIAIRSGKSKVKLNDTLKTLKVLKNALEASGYNYQELILEERFDLDNPSKIQRLSVLLSENITPKRREKVLKEAGWNELLCQKLLHSKFGGTVNVCDRYMVAAINAFLNGETYGKFKSRWLRERRLANSEKAGVECKNKILPAFTKKMDEEIVQDIVVFKSLNEARKIINAIVRKYGSPNHLNITVADYLGRSFKAREKLAQKQSESTNDTRFITRYIANYLKSNLLFAGDDDKNVRVVKSNIATKMYKAWLNGERCEECSQEPLISYKQNKKFQGKLTDDNPISKAKRKDSSIAKLDSLGNENVLSANKYYCVEIYKDSEKRTAFRGIRFVDFKKKDKKLYLTVPYPENYGAHVMYLFANDYIKIFDEQGNLKFDGYYRSVRAATRSLLNLRNGNENKDFAYYVTRKDVFKKYDVDVLGNLGGEVKCFKPFTLLEQEQN